MEDALDYIEAEEYYSGDVGPETVDEEMERELREVNAAIAAEARARGRRQQFSRYS